MESAPAAASSWQRVAPYLSAGIMLCFGLVLGYLVYTGPVDSYAPNDDSEEQGNGLPPSGPAVPNYLTWKEPSLAIVISGQMHGYFNPCGCSSPQFGGVERRFNFVESLRNKPKGWSVIGIDLGENIQQQDRTDGRPPKLAGLPAQNILKYELTVKSLAAMNYRALGIGHHELLLPLGAALAQIEDAKRPLPRHIGTTLADAAPGKNLHSLNARPYEIISNTNPKIGVISMIGPDLRLEHKQEQFLANQTELSKALKAFAAAGVEIGVILHHEYPDVPGQGIEHMREVEKKRRETAKVCADFCAEQRRLDPKVPPIGLMVILTDEAEPPFLMRQLDPKLPTQLIEIGHKGKYVGLVGLFREKQGFRVEYQAVLMSPDWDTPKNKLDKHPIIALSEAYLLQLKKQDLLGKLPRTMHMNQILNANGVKSNYVGSDTCKRCHREAFKIWEDTAKNEKGHAKATARLENLKHPYGRHWDPECMQCHVVGLKHPGGYQNPPNNKDLAAHNKALRGVGCESCHGPASAHVENPDNEAIRAMINPYAPSKDERKYEADLKKDPTDAKAKLQFERLLKSRLLAMEQSCIKCHDHENDVHWKGDWDGPHGIYDHWIRRGTIHRTDNDPPAKLAPPIEKKVEPAAPEIKIEVAPQPKSQPRSPSLFKGPIFGPRGKE